MTQFTWKQKIVLGLFTGLVHFSLLYIFNTFTQEVVDIKGLIFQGLFMGMFFASLFPFLMKKAEKKLIAKVDIIAKDIIISPEEIIYDGGANQIKGREGVGGKLFITNQRILFISHKFNIQNGETTILSENVKNIEKVKLSRFFNTGILITLEDATTYKFVVNKQEEWFSKLNSYIQAA